jgi:hypothetical protein
VPEVYWAGLVLGRVFLFMEDLGPGESLYEKARAGTLREDELEKLALLLETLCEKGCSHRDFHSGNLLWRAGAWHLLDMDQVRLHSGPLLAFEVEALLLGLFSSLESLEKKQHALYLDRLVPLTEHLSRDTLLVSLEKKRWRVWEKHFASRVRKSFTDSSSWKHPEKGLFLRRELSEEGVKESFQSQAKTWLKEDRGRWVYRSDMAGTPVVIKEFRQGDWRRLFHRQPLRRSWRNALQLELRNISAPRALALWEKADGSGKIMMEDLPEARGLDRWIYENWEGLGDGEKERELKAFAAFVTGLLEKRIWPLDFKACNVLRREGAYFLVDHDAFFFGAPVPDRLVQRGLAQLHLSLPARLDGSRRETFVALLNLPSAPKILANLRRELRGREILFQTASGDKVEKL